MRRILQGAHHGLSPVGSFITPPDCKNLAQNLPADYVLASPPDHTHSHCSTVPSTIAAPAPISDLGLQLQSHNIRGLTGGHGHGMAMSAGAIALLSISGLAVLLVCLCITEITKGMMWSRTHRWLQQYDELQDQNTTNGATISSATNMQVLNRVNSPGLGFWLISHIPVAKYSSSSAATPGADHDQSNGETLILPTECAVCLGCFEEEEKVRVLPQCRHAFHPPCIDQWFVSHCTCPVCRKEVTVDAINTVMLATPDPPHDAHQLPAAATSTFSSNSLTTLVSNSLGSDDVHEDGFVITSSSEQEGNISFHVDNISTFPRCSLGSENPCFTQSSHSSATTPQPGSSNNAQSSTCSNMNTSDSPLIVNFPRTRSSGGIPIGYINWQPQYCAMHSGFRRSNFNTSFNTAVSKSAGTNAEQQLYSVGSNCGRMLLPYDRNTCFTDKLEQYHLNQIILSAVDADQCHGSNNDYLPVLSADHEPLMMSILQQQQLVARHSVSSYLQYHIHDQAQPAVVTIQRNAEINHGKSQSFSLFRTRN